MSNSTFSGPVRSQDGFDSIIKNSSGAVTSTMSMETYVATITVADGATTGKESAIGIPSNFIPMGVTVAVTGAASNAVNLNDIGTDADTDGFVDGISAPGSPERTTSTSSAVSVAAVVVPPDIPKTPLQVML